MQAEADALKTAKAASGEVKVDKKKKKPEGDADADAKVSLYGVRAPMSYTKGPTHRC